jgi:hypothetical protein
MKLPIKKRVLVMLIISIVAIILGLTMSYYSKPQAMESVFPMGIGLIFIVAGVFSFGFLFFGYLTPVMMFLSGIHFGFLFKFAGELTGFVIAWIIASMLAAYSSIRLGDALLDDLIGKGNFRGALKTSIMVLMSAIVIALIMDFAIV